MFLAAICIYKIALIIGMLDIPDVLLLNVCTIYSCEYFPYNAQLFTI